jgi:hypothetical protein
MLHRVLGVKTGRSRAPKNRKMGKKYPIFRVFGNKQKSLCRNLYNTPYIVTPEAAIKADMIWADFLKESQHLVEFNRKHP